MKYADLMDALESADPEPDDEVRVWIDGYSIYTRRENERSRPQRRRSQPPPPDPMLRQTRLRPTTWRRTVLVSATGWSEVWHHLDPERSWMVYRPVAQDVYHWTLVAVCGYQNDDRVALVEEPPDGLRECKSCTTTIARREARDARESA